MKAAFALADLGKFLPAKAKPYAKALVALAGAVAGYVALHYGDSEWGTSVVGLATALGVYTSSNA
jgi:hypothetical protein